MDFNVVIIGAGEGGKSILSVLLQMDKVHIMGIADKNPHAPGMVMARESGVYTTQDYRELIEWADLDVIIEATGKTEVQKDIRRLKKENAALMEAQAAHLMMELIAKHKELVRSKELQEQLSTILNAAQEGIQVTDKQGKVLYVNRAFTDILNIKEYERIGKNVFDVSPDGSLVEVLRTGKPVFGKISIPKGSQVEVVANASPIMVDGRMTGAVTVFRDITDIRRLATKLEESKDVINSLKEELTQLVTARYRFSDIEGKDPQFLRAINVAKQATMSDSTILITGESGTGKELFAHAIHNAGNRSQGPFIMINCAAIPETLLESELFGFEKGAFTGANKTKIGKFELAHGGTIFLDEIGDMSISLQAKILRTIQEKVIERLGSNKPASIDVRIIAATHRDLLKKVEDGSFREDLYYRLNVINVHIPPLRARKGDIPALVKRIITKMNTHYSRNCSLDEQGLEFLQQYQWPGNVRELENILERAVILCGDGDIPLELLQSYLQPQFLDAESGLVPLWMVEKQVILKALEKYGYTLDGKKLAAEKLGISLATLYNKLNYYKNSSKK